MVQCVNFIRHKNHECSRKCKQKEIKQLINLSSNWLRHSQVCIYTFMVLTRWKKLVFASVRKALFIVF